jgi:hypothetical protein
MDGEKSGSAMTRPEYDTFPIKVELQYAIKKGNGENAIELTELEINRRLQARDLLGIPAASMTFDDTVKIISRLTGQPRGTIELMDGKDMLNFTEIINYFLGIGQ